MEKYKTAVEFLIEELKLQEMADKNGLTMIKEILDNAIDMEKEQIESSFHSGRASGIFWGDDAPYGDKYYKDLYEKNNQ